MSEGGPGDYNQRYWKGGRMRDNRTPHFGGDQALKNDAAGRAVLKAHRGQLDRNSSDAQRTNEAAIRRMCPQLRKRT